MYQRIHSFSAENTLSDVFLYDATSFKMEQGGFPSDLPVLITGIPSSSYLIAGRVT